MDKFVDYFEILAVNSNISFPIFYQEGQEQSPIKKSLWYEPFVANIPLELHLMFLNYPNNSHPKYILKWLQQHSYTQHPYKHRNNCLEEHNTIYLYNSPVSSTYEHNIAEQQRQTHNNKIGCRWFKFLLSLLLFQFPLPQLQSSRSTQSEWIVYHRYILLKEEIKKKK